jgi:formylglycine-generating enzyme
MNPSFLLGAFVILHSAFIIPATAQEALPRTALLMGVGDYGGAKYKGQTIQNLPGIITADLPGMESKLKTLRFDVTVVPNPTLSQAKTAVDAFSARIKARPGVSLFYFSGHGGEYEGKNFLIPRGASIASTADLSDEALSAQRVLNGMEESGAQVNLVFLDCCREDLGKNIGGAELQPMKARGSFIGFATRSGDFADPGAEGSPYTRFLLQHLDRPGLSVADMYGYVIRDVKDYTKKMLGEERRPGFYSELEGDPFYFVPVKLTTPQTGAPAMTDDVIERRARELAAKMVPAVPPASVPSLPASSGSILDQGAVGKAIQVKLPGDVLMKFSFCPPGSFMMGSPKSEAYRSDAEDQVQVRISKGFWMAQTEVTQGQWKAMMGKKRGVEADDFPVEFVSWEDAQAFITKLNQSVPLTSGWEYALPTEAQWEYACRAGTETVFSFGDVPNGKLANFNGGYPDGTFTMGPYLGKTCAVANYAPNAWGIHDMHGNVWEWCADWLADKLPGGTDPVGPASGAYRVYRGGSYYHNASSCRAANRSSNVPGIRNDFLGFRVAAVPAEAR